MKTRHNLSTQNAQRHQRQMRAKLISRLTSQAFGQVAWSILVAALLGVFVLKGNIPLNRAPSSITGTPNVPEAVTTGDPWKVTQPTSLRAP